MTHYITTRTLIEPITDTINVGTYLAEQKFYVNLYNIELGITTNIYLENQNDFVIELPELLDLRISSNISLEEQILLINQLSLQEKVYLDTFDLTFDLLNYDSIITGDGVVLNTIDLLIEVLHLKRDEGASLITPELIISLLNATAETVETIRFPIVEGLTNIRGVTFTEGLTNTRSNKTFTEGLINKRNIRTFIEGLTNKRR